MSARVAPPVKVVLVGDSGVGKTALVTAYCRGGFEWDCIATVAPARSTATVKVQGGAEVTLHIWDTAGQEAYHAISQSFYRDARVALVCYAPASPEPIAAWIGRVRAAAPACAVLLVATKADLLAQDERVALCSSGLALAQAHGARAHYVTSAKTGQAVEEVFYGAADARAGAGFPDAPAGVDPAAPARRGGCC
jgi:small GTP-binding protein